MSLEQQLQPNSISLVNNNNNDAKCLNNFILEFEKEIEVITLDDDDDTFRQLVTNSEDSGLDSELVNFEFQKKNDLKLPQTKFHLSPIETEKSINSINAFQSNVYLSTERFVFFLIHYCVFYICTYIFLYTYTII